MFYCIRSKRLGFQLLGRINKHLRISDKHRANNIVILATSALKAHLPDNKCSGITGASKIEEGIFYMTPALDNSSGQTNS